MSATLLALLLVVSPLVAQQSVDEPASELNAEDSDDSGTEDEQPQDDPPEGPGAATPDAAQVPDTAPLPDAAQVPAPALIDTAEAQPVPDLTPEQAEWLKPKLNLLPPNTKAQTDFTAYVLEWGEIKLGLNTIQIGVLPGLQAGSSVPLLALRVPNANLKLDFVRWGPLDLAATGQWYSMPREGFEGRFVSTGGMLSLQILEAWSLHGGSSYAWIDTAGFPDVSQLSSWITGDSEVIDVGGELADATLGARVLTVRAATDIRFNRRDSIVLQFSSIPWASVTTDPVPENIPPIFGLDQLLALNGSIPVSQSYTASLAWQIQWKHAQLRVGIGHSSTSLAWLTQCVDFSYRFLGATRIREYRQRRTWRQNQQAAERGTLDQSDEQAPEESEE